MSPRWQASRPGLAAAALVGINAQRLWMRAAPVAGRVDEVLPRCD